MTTPNNLQRLNRPLLTLAAILVSAAFGLWGSERALAALAGVIVGLANWFSLGWLMGRLVLAQRAQRAVISLLLVGKIGLLMAIVFVLLRHLKLDAVGLLWGLSVLFLGPVISALLVGAPSAVAREEN
ncbi:MAG: hypothetical protein QM778_01820 [Myxococcales bacterium]